MQSGRNELSWLISIKNVVLPLQESTFQNEHFRVEFKVFATTKLRLVEQGSGRFGDFSSCSFSYPLLSGYFRVEFTIERT